MKVSTGRAFKAFAWLCMLIGFGLIMLEAFVHYRHYLSRHNIPESPWSAVSLALGAVLLLFGAGVIQYTDTKKALELFGYILPFITNLASAVRIGGRRSTDPAAPTPEAPTVLHGTETKISTIGTDESDDSPIPGVHV